jgi:parallel beta-helix repeat protein
MFVTNSGLSGPVITIGSYGTGAKPIVYGDHPSVSWTAVAGYSGIYTNSPTGLVGGGVTLTYVNIQSVFDGNGVAYYSFGRQGSTNIATWIGNMISNTNTAIWGLAADWATIYLKTPGGGAPTGMHLFDNYTVRGLGGYAFVRDLEVCHGGSAIFVSGQGNVVSNNLIHDCTGSGVNLTGAWNSEVVSNTIQHNAYTMIYLIQPGGNNWIHFNTLQTNSLVICGNVNVGGNPDTSGVGFLGQTNNLVEHNIVTYQRQAFFDYFYEANSEVRYNYCFHSAGDSVGGTGMKVHHNIFDGDNIGNGETASHYWSTNNQIPYDTGQVLVYNNVFYNFHSAGLYVVGSSATNVIIRNNIFVTSSTYSGGGMAVCTGEVDSDYNLYYSTGISPRWFWNGTQTYTLPSYFASSGLEQHSIYTNARFVSANPTNALDFNITSTSPCVGAGQNLKTAGFLASTNQYQDYLGTQIPQGARPDIGAYEKKVSSVGPPTDLHIRK